MRFVDFAVVGGGIAGLASALRLRALEPSARIALLEADSRVGGKIIGARVDGCIIDGGPDICAAAKVERTKVYQDLDIEPLTIPVNPGRLPTFRRTGNSLQPLPGLATDGLVTFYGGMVELVDVIRNELVSSVDIRTEWPVESIEPTEDGFTLVHSNMERITARAVVLAVPAMACGKLLQGAAPAASNAAVGIPYRPMTTVSVAWRASDVHSHLGGTGFLVSDAQPGELSACTWTSSKIPSRSPWDIVLMRGYCGSAGPTAAAGVVDEICRLTGARADPLFVRSFGWDNAIPVYAADHAALVAEIEAEAERLGTIAVAGAAFHGVGIGDCMASGERAAETVVLRLRQRFVTEQK